jgi:hypothetical protein
MLQGLARKSQKLAGTLLPEFWREDVAVALREVYGELVNNHKMDLSVWGEIYPDEVLVIASMADQKDLNRIPLSFFISADLGTNQKSEALVKAMVDALGVRFDDYFSNPEWQDHHDAWQEMTLGKHQLFTKSNRENIYLTLQANQILSAAGIDPSGDEYEE